MQHVSNKDFFLWPVVHRSEFIVLDPRYKQAFFIKAPQDRIFQSEWVQQCHNELLDTLKNDHTSYVAPLHSPVKRSLTTKTFSFGDPAVFAPDEGAASSAPSSPTEVTLYESEPCIGATHDPLLWWQANAFRFPTLAEMARIYLAIPGMSFSHVSSSHVGSQNSLRVLCQH